MKGGNISTAVPIQMQKSNSIKGKRYICKSGREEEKTMRKKRKKREKIRKGKELRKINSCDSV